MNIQVILVRMYSNKSEITTNSDCRSARIAPSRGSKRCMITKWLIECENSSISGSRSDTTVSFEQNNNQRTACSISLSGTDTTPECTTIGLSNKLGELTFANLRQLCPDVSLPNTAALSDETSEANVSLVALRRNQREFGHLSIYEQFRRIGSAAILLQPARERNCLAEMIRRIERNFPHGIRSTTITNCLTDQSEHVLPNFVKLKLAELFEMDFITDLLYECTE